MKYIEQEFYGNIDRIVTETPKTRFGKTARGLKLDNVEFIFATDREVTDDNYIVIKGKKEQCVMSPMIRQKLLKIYDRK